MKNHKINSLAKWIIVAIAIATLAYNTITSHVISKNEVKHLTAEVRENKREFSQDIQELKLEIRDLRLYLMNK